MAEALQRAACDRAYLDAANQVLREARARIGQPDVGKFSLARAATRDEAEAALLDPSLWADWQATADETINPDWLRARYGELLSDWLGETLGIGSRR